MSRGGDTRFAKGQSGNPAGRPKQRRPHVSAFDIIFDKVLTVTQGGKERELTVDEALQLQTYQAALNGSKMAIRQVLKMIEKREVALAKRDKPSVGLGKIEHEHCADNARSAMTILGLIEHDANRGDQDDPDKQRMKVTNWAAQAALSRPGRRKFDEKDVKDITFFTSGSDKLKWPRGRKV